MTCGWAFRWLQDVRKMRMFVSLVAIKPGVALSSASERTGVNVNERGIRGCVTLTVRRVEAQLPPPFPSKAPLRLYVCNMAVSATCRRQGIARALLREAERIGKAAPGLCSPIMRIAQHRWAPFAFLFLRGAYYLLRNPTLLPSRPSLGREEPLAARGARQRRCSRALYLLRVPVPQHRPVVVPG
jgi:GNAT superfamily N-acetyltransferase